MGRDPYKLTKIFYDVIVMLILWHYQNTTAEKVEGFQRFWLNISKTVQLIFTKFLFFRESYIKVFKIKSLKIDHSLLPS